MDDLDEDHSDSRPLLEMRRLIGGECSDCRQRFSPRDAFYSIVLGFKNAPRCLACLAVRLDRVAGELATQLVDHIHRRDCFLKAWREAESLESTSRTTSTNFVTTRMDDSNTITTSKAEWDAGDKGCGELVMMLRMKLKGMSGGDILKVRATDPAAPEDIPAWCRMTGNNLVNMQHPIYFIRRKEG
jgi:tRNA 2-thiouridine synthesizing protein A